MRQTRWHRLHHVLRKRRRRAALALLAVAALASAVAANPTDDKYSPSSAPSPTPPGTPHTGDVRGAPPALPPPARPTDPPGDERGRPTDDRRVAAVRIADAGVVRLLRRGDLVDVLATAPDAGWTGSLAAGPAPASAVGAADGSGGIDGTHGAHGSAAADAAPRDRPAEREAAADDGPPAGPRVIAHAARVVDVPPARETAPGEGALVVLSVPRETATALVGTGLAARLAVVRR
ncbi:hypothetical protein OYE22_12120 [Streptomyces sp. 71268]|uniref:hypothetical protein n=1 Tax=Streptomyces sp. 71268 TaxID=3002640 RepID=UPI0023F82B3D|nr:hypothetical protein [Streptomyces sp. 71268]WEV25856.1 hypothetical protein OYE22_12120 [Streptomyces sp. 71268]